MAFGDFTFDKLQSDLGLTLAEADLYHSFVLMRLALEYQFDALAHELA